MAPPTLESKFLGCMVGTALGDALGELAGVHDTREDLIDWIGEADSLRYTDETAMAIGLAEAIADLGGVDPQHLGEIIRAKYSREPWRGYGHTTPQVFALVGRRKMPYVDAVGSLNDGRGSDGNGAAKRIAPLGLAFYNAADLREKAESSARVTHTHPVGIDGAAVQAWTVAYVVKLDPGAPFPMADFCEGLVRFAQTNQMRRKLVDVIAALADQLPDKEAAAQLGNGNHVVESMSFALYAFLHHLDSFEECLFCATLHGGERESIGAMACALSGAYLGIEKIPKIWRDKVEDYALMEELSRKLIGMA